MDVIILCFRYTQHFYNVHKGFKICSCTQGLQICVRAPRGLVVENMRSNIFFTRISFVYIGVLETPNYPLRVFTKKDNLIKLKYLQYI